jgi:D-alanyl-D-alanine dipeptidase
MIFYFKARRLLRCGISLAIALVLAGCASEGTIATHLQTTATVTAAASSSVSAPASTPLPSATETLYTIGTITAAEGEFVYAYAEKSTDSDIVGAAAGGVDFAVAETADGWYQIMYDGETAYIQTQYLAIQPQQAALPVHTPYARVSAHEETGLVQTKYNNKLTVKASIVNGAQQLDVYTQSGKLLLKNATLVVTDGKITAPAITDDTPKSCAFRGPQDTTRAIARYGAGIALEGGSPDPSSPEPTPTPAPTSTEAPTPTGTPEASASSSPTPTPTPVSITVKGGKVTQSAGITLEKDKGFNIGKDIGAIITGDQTVIAFDTDFYTGVQITVTAGRIYSASSYVELEQDYYLVPALLKDNLVDVAQYSDGIVIDMLFAKDGNLLGDAIYDHEICLLQKGTLEKLKKAQEIFAQDGYTIILYDAYRPYSVTVALYDRYKDGTFVAPPRFGSMHNKGAAVDMSLLDANGVPLEMPSAIHTLNDTSRRDNRAMSDTAKANMNYMAGVMRRCGFTTIDSEWWHFSDSDCMQYLRTDHDLNKVLRVIYE